MLRQIGRAWGLGRDHLDGRLPIFFSRVRRRPTGQAINLFMPIAPSVLLGCLAKAWVLHD